MILFAFAFSFKPDKEKSQEKNKFSQRNISNRDSEGNELTKEQQSMINPSLQHILMAGSTIVVKMTGITGQHIYRIKIKPSGRQHSILPMPQTAKKFFMI